MQANKLGGEQMKKLFFVLALLVLVGLPFVRAATPGGADMSDNADRGAYAGASAGTMDVTSGHIYFANVTGVQNTYRWVGLYGNVSGVITLADSSGNYFYNWTGAKGVLVYASTGSSITWSSLADADSTDMDSWLEGSFTDSYSNTFSGTENIGSQIFTSLTSDYAAPYPTASGWRTYSLTDGTNLVWAGKVLSSAATTYDGTTADFEMLIPENGTAGDETATTYYFWVELQ